MTEHQKALRAEAKKRNRAKVRKIQSGNTLQMCADGIMRMRKDIRAEKMKDKRNTRRNKTHKTNIWQFSDNRKPATLCGEMLSDTLDRTILNDDVTCVRCKKMIERAWKQV